MNRMRRKWGKKNGNIGFWEEGSRGPHTDKREKKPRYRTRVAEI